MRRRSPRRSATPRTRTASCADCRRGRCARRARSRSRITSSSAVHSALPVRRCRSRSGRCPGTSSAGSRRTGSCRRGACVNHCGCSVTQGWSGRTWNAMSSATSMPSSVRRARRGGAKSSSVPSSGWIALWPPCRRADGPGAAGVAAFGARGRVVASFAVDVADRMDRRQVDATSKPIGGDVRKPRLEVGERAVLCPSAASGTRKELVPRREAGPFPINLDNTRRLSNT